MYLKFYGLREEPFGVTPDPRFLYLSPGYREALATLEYGIRSGRGFTALIAKPGMGKTTLLFNLLERYSQSARTAFIFQTQCDSREFLRYLMAEMGLDVADGDIVQLQDKFQQLLVREAKLGKKVIAIIDEAQNLDVDVLETVRLLSDFETSTSKLLHIILSGQPELGDKLASPPLLQLRQRISHLIRLDPLSHSEVNEYIDHRLRTAGHFGQPLFTPEARQLIVDRSEGIPRNISNLCFNALSASCGMGKRVVDIDVLREIAADLDFDALSRDLRDEPRPVATPVQLTPRSGWAAEEVETVDDIDAEEKHAAGAGHPLEAEYAAEQRDDSDMGPAGGRESELPAVFAPHPPTVLPTAAIAAMPGQEAAVSSELGNLALSITPPEIAAAHQPLDPPPAVESSEPREADGKPVPADPDLPPVDVDALARDCALLGMEAPRRYKRPWGATPNPAVAQMPKPANAGMVSTVPGVRAGTPDAPIPPNLSGPAATPANASKLPGQPTLVPPRSPSGPIPRPPAALRPKHPTKSQVYLAAGTFVLLILLVWLIARTGSGSASASRARVDSPSAGGTDSSSATDSSASATQGPAASPDDQEASSPTDHSELDVVEQLPRVGGSDSIRLPVVPQRSRDRHPAGVQLLRRVDPIYPAAAKLNRIQGTVVLQASIGTDGFLRHIRVVNGNPLLADATLEAVRDWRYKPYRVRGQRSEIPTEITINFRLVSKPGLISSNR